MRSKAIAYDKGSVSQLHSTVLYRFVQVLRCAQNDKIEMLQHSRGAVPAPVQTQCVSSYPAGGATPPVQKTTRSSLYIRKQFIIRQSDPYMYGAQPQGDIIYLPNKATERKSGFRAALDIFALALILPLTGVERRRDKAVLRRMFRFSGA